MLLKVKNTIICYCDMDLKFAVYILTIFNLAVYTTAMHSHTQTCAVAIGQISDLEYKMTTFCSNYHFENQVLHQPVFAGEIEKNARISVEILCCPIGWNDQKYKRMYVLNVSTKF